MLTPEEFKDKMKSIYKAGEMGDTELSHILADDLMCQLLTELGYAEGVRIFIEAYKWYA